MTRYIDADESLDRLPNDLPYKASVKRILIQAPTADVVPKSEVDEIIGAFDTWLYKHYNGDISDWDLYKLFAELKKKYTKEQE